MPQNHKTTSAQGTGRPSLAVSLLLEGRPALVVGGGKVGLRKARLLLEAGAAVTVVAPAVCPELDELAAAGRLAILRRQFEPGDPAGAAVVFAATDDAAVNRQILAAARSAGALVCAVDGNWPDGDFLTPASIRRGGLQVAVSTGGKSCRQSRLVKESLGLHLEALDSLTLVVLGTGHEVLAAAAREPFHLDEAGRQRAGALLRQLRGVHEFMLLNTCNRIELIAAAAPDDCTVGLAAKILGLDRLGENRRYCLSGREAFEHLCLLAAGMRSQSMGETHITAQVKDAIAEAVGNGWANGLLRDWVDAALHVSKEIRGQVGPGLRGGEIEDVCLGYLREAAPCSAAGGVMVIGSGVVGHGLVERVLELGCQCVCWCFHRRRPELPAEWAGRVELCDFNGLRDRLGAVAVVLAAVEAPSHVLHEAHAPFFDRENGVLVIDLAMPRSVDPRLAGAVPGLKLVDLDGLKHWQRRGNGILEPALERSRSIIREHLELHERIQQSIQGG